MRAARPLAALPAQNQPHTQHRPTRIHEDTGLAEIRMTCLILSEQVIGYQALFRSVIERIEYVEHELDSWLAAECEGPRQPHIQECL